MTFSWIFQLLVMSVIMAATVITAFEVSVSWCEPTKQLLTVPAQMFRLQNCRAALKKLYGQHVERWHDLLRAAKVYSRDDYDRLPRKTKQTSDQFMSSLYKLHLLQFWIEREINSLKDAEKPRESNDIYEQQLYKTSGEKRIVEFDSDDQFENEGDAEFDLHEAIRNV